jgi:hypothetical protein
MKLRSHTFLTLFLLTLAQAPTAAAGEENGNLAFPYGDWRRVLGQVVDKDGLVDYASLARDTQTLDRVIAAIEAVSPRSHPNRFESPDHELAYYINAYNALVFRGVLDKGPDIATVWGKTGSGLGFFVRRRFTVGGERTNLKRFEDVWVRERFHDPRIHAALNCASVGCPRLPRAPFSPDALDAELDAAMAEFVSSPENVVVDDADRVVILSKIFDWFRSDFLDFEAEQGVEEPALIDYVNRYRESERPIPSDYRVQFDTYDKRLNRQP